MNEELNIKELLAEKIEYQGWEISGELSYISNKTVCVYIYNRILNIGMKIERDVEKTIIINNRSYGNLWGYKEKVEKQVLYDEEKTLKELVNDAKFIIGFLVVHEEKVYDDALKKLSLIHMPMPLPMPYGDFKEKIEKEKDDN